MWRSPPSFCSLPPSCSILVVLHTVTGDLILIDRNLVVWSSHIILLFLLLLRHQNEVQTPHLVLGTQDPSWSDPALPRWSQLCLAHWAWALWHFFNSLSRFPTWNFNTSFPVLRALSASLFTWLTLYPSGFRLSLPTLNRFSCYAHS